MKQYSIFLGIIMFFICENSFSQIVYTDITPDESMIGWGKGFDFNNDEEMDFSYADMENTFLCNGHSFWSNGTVEEKWEIPKPLVENTPIGAGGNFLEVFDMAVNYYGGENVFPVGQDSYIGVKLTFSDNTHYGWIRVMWDGTNYIYKDYAYQSTPNTVINAGEKEVSTGVEDYKLDDIISVYPNPATDKVCIQQSGSIELDYVSIYEMSGGLLDRFEMNQPKMEINVSTYSDQVLLLKVVDKTGNTYFKKVLKK